MKPPVFGLFVAVLLFGITPTLALNETVKNIQPEIVDPERWHNVWAQNADTVGDILSSHSLFRDLGDGNYFSERALELMLGKQTNISQSCLNATAQFLIDLLSNETYPRTVLDATGKLPSGLLTGNVWWIGSFGQCRNISEYRKNVKLFKGQYCTVLLTIIINPLTPTQLALPTNLGLCVSDECSNFDVTTLFAEGIMEIPPLQSSTVYVKVNGASCSVDKEWTVADIVAVGICGVLCFFLLCGTLYDIAVNWKVSQAEVEAHVAVHGSLPVQTVDVSESLAQDGVATSENRPEGQPLIPVTTQRRGRDLIGQILLCFSVRTNMRKLMNTHQREGTLSCLNGIRFLSMSWVILGHTHAFVFSFGDNPIVATDIIGRFTFQAVANATVSVDSFFFLSGLLVTYLTLRQMTRGMPCSNWVLFYFHRFWRLTPMYALIIFLWSTLFLHLPNGIAMRGMDSASDQCKKYWWSNLLYISNFVPWELGEECLGWSWYLANDMQFFVISPLFLLPLYWCRHERFQSLTRWRIIKFLVMSSGAALVVFVMFVSVMATGFIATNHNLALGLIPQPGKGTLTDSSVYVRPWTRIPSYLVGMLTGYVLFVTGGRIRMKKELAVIGWFVAAGVAIAIVYGLYPVNHSSKVYNQAVDSLYIATHRMAWCMCLGWVVLACTTGYGGPINKLLSWEAWVPLARVTYGAYLLHPMVIYLYLLSLKHPIHYTDINLIWIFLGHLVLSYMGAILLAMVIEAPTLALEKIMFKRKTQ